MNSEFFPQRPIQNPTIYVYEIIGAKNREGLLKVGFTNRSAVEPIKEQVGTSGLEYYETTAQRCFCPNSSLKLSKNSSFTPVNSSF